MDRGSGSFPLLSWRVVKVYLPGGLVIAHAGTGCA